VADTKLLVPAVEVADHSDPGRDPEKQVNEDACRHGETPFGYLLVLCDGMGGHEGGREASMLAVETIFRYFAVAAERPDIPRGVRAREVLQEAIGTANHEVFSLSTAKGAARPGSTLVAALLHPLGTDVAHVGDSRCYLVHEGHVRQVTRDHSMVQQLVDAGALTAEQAVGHPDANMITRALGMAATVEVELQRHAVAHETGDVFVLCSDGLSDLVDANDILRVVAKSPAAQAVTELVDLANARGGHDNITVMMMRAREPAHASSGAVAESVVLARTETMPAVAAPSGSDVPPSGPTSKTLPMNGGVAPVPLPPLPHVPRRKRSPAVVLGVLLGLVGVGAVAAVVALEVLPHSDTNAVPGLALSVVLPASSLSPGADPTPDAAADTPVADAGARVRHYKKRPRK
jgi:serine/threonine protein phosphatase PrpC